MRTIHVIPVALLIGLISCNDSSDKSPASTDTAKVMATDTMNMNHSADTAKMATALPTIPAGARVYFKNLKNGQSISSPYKVEMGIEGLKLDSAGAIIAGSGHHHLLIDAEDSLAAGTVVPKDDKHMHFGKAQSSVELKLPAGKHKLTLQYADGIHRSYGSQLSTTVTVTVKQDKAGN